MLNLPNPFKAQKLKITSADDPSKKFEAMFNPNEYTVRYRNDFRVNRTLTPTTAAATTPAGGEAAGPTQLTQMGQDPMEFSINLVLDGTGVNEMALATGFGLDVPTVKSKVNDFITLCYTVAGNLHRTKRVKVEWGIVNFEGVLEDVSVKYTLFDPSGEPLRAEMTAQFLAETPVVELSSPDLTHTRTVRAGDTLPLLAKEIYGSSRFYLLVARANDLDDFRNIPPGTVLRFPPLERGQIRAG